MPSKTGPGKYLLFIRITLENTVASSTEQREVGCCIKKGGTRASETALEPQLIKVI
jgi:hypothetical protein